MSLSPEWKDKPVKYLRDKVVDQLKYSLVKNHLEIDEFEQLVKIALSTQSKSELLSLTVDLPIKDKNRVEDQEKDLIIYKDTESMISILSATKKRGMWTVPKQLKVLTVLGDSEIDFRDAQFKSDLTYLSLGCWLGDSKIIVPPGVNVVSNVKNIMGSVDCGTLGRMNPDSPTIVIEGRVILGEFNVVVKE